LPRGECTAALSHRGRVDPPASSGKGADASGLVAAGIAEDGTLYVIADETQVEVNQGGEMVKAVIGEADAEVKANGYALSGWRLCSSRAG